MQTTVVVRSSNETAERAILFSMINAICCNLFFGIIAMFIALAVGIVSSMLLSRLQLSMDCTFRLKITSRMGGKRKVED
jgi:hypothetical protein